MIPSNDMGGHGSAVIANGRVYMSVVWHTDLPSDTRTIDALVFRTLGARNTRGIAPEKIAALDELVLNLSSRIRGSQLTDMANKWVAENLDRKQRMSQGDYFISRFKKGAKNIPFADYEKLETVRDNIFASDEALRSWVTSQGFSEFVQQRIIKAVPPTYRVAKDTIVCLDLKTGKTLWKAESPGEPKGRSCSSTPAVADGFVYAIGSTHLYCVNAKTGEIKWSTALKRKGASTSPLVIDGVVVVHADYITAYDTASGEEKWSHPKTRVANASPVAWSKDGKTFVISHDRSALVAYDPQSGEEQWSIAAGGDSTPAIHGDLLAVQCKNEKLGLIAIKLDIKEPRMLWSHPIVARRSQSSPIIHEGNVYLVDSSKAYCIEGKSGKVIYLQTINAAITSPVMADGKVFLVTDRGNNITMLRPGKEELSELGKHRIKALSCPSPTVTDGYMIVRQADRLVAFDLTESQGL